MIPKIKRRAYYLSNPIQPKAPFNIVSLYETAIRKNTNKYDKQLLENWQYLSEDANEAFNKALIILERAYDDEFISSSKIVQYTNIFTENIIPKVRNTSQMQRSIKRRLSGIKTKISTKINKAIEVIKAAHAKRSSIPATTRTQQATNEAKLNSINKIEKAIDECITIDRVLNNHIKLNKRFSIDRFVKESVFVPSQVKDNVIEFCRLIDTYDIPPEAKFSVVIENALYAYECNHIQYIKKDILEAATDYFLMNYNNINEALVNRMQKSELYNEADYKNIDISLESSENLFSEATPDGYQAIGNITAKLSNAARTSRETAKVLIKEFKLSPEKTPKSFSDLITKIFTKSDKQIIEETPNILDMVFSFFIVTAAFSMSAVLGILVTLIMCILKLHLDIKETDNQISIYEKHLAKVNTKIKQTNKNRARLERYSKQLEKDIEKLKEYRDSLKSQEELDAENNDDFEINDESTIQVIGDLKLIESAIDTLMKSKYNFIDNIDNKINNLSIADIDTITEASIKYPDLIDPHDLCNILEEQRTLTLKSSNINRYIRSTYLSDNINKLESFTETQINENNTINDSITYFSDKIIVAESIMEYLESISKISPKPILEMKFTNSINMIIDRVKKAAENLSEKEKVLSRTLDTSLDKFQDAITNSLKSENREAVIKGNILPPFSRVLKIAITSGLAWVVHPALSLIPIIGSYALSKDLRRKEREMILDELDVELEMCNKYIRIAEDKNDMKGLRQLLMIKKKLESQRNRLRYKMQTTYNEPIKASDQDDD